MDAGVVGTFQWAYCVTCGAWAALGLWDHITYAELSVQSAVAEEVILSFKGISEFFLCYMHNSGGVYYTGPTTSPENSYRALNKDGKPHVKALELAFSPAIDLSILKNVAEAYALALQVSLICVKELQRSHNYIGWQLILIQS